MSDIITVAQGTFERFAKLVALYVILLICVLDVAAMGLYKDLTMGMDQELMLDCALAICTAVGLITAMVASFDIPRELREKSATIILAKPGGRAAFIWGKFIGIGFLGVYNIAIVTAGCTLVMYMKYGEFSIGFLQGAALVAAESVVLTAMGVFFSMFLADSMAAIAVFLAFAIGHATFMLQRLDYGVMGDVVYYAFPSFYNLDIKTEVGNGMTIPNAFVGMGVGYALAYAFFFVGLSMLLFRRKDI